MSAKKHCCFLFFDYVDFDVYLNARVFYRLAGYTIIPPEKWRKCALLIVFRGIPTHVYSEYYGPIHFYDYVREHVIDLCSIFPNATSISVISFEKSIHDFPNLISIYGYLPVIPALWQFSSPFSRKSTLPIHISNYKPLVDDSYQQQLISLIKAGKIDLFGGKWDRIHLIARPLSFLSANLKLSSALICFGLMYPYQRGKSLSGRMWQAPLHGCLVISEKHTNLFSCPGVIEVESFYHLPSFDFMPPAVLAKQAAQFWFGKTTALAKDLNLDLNSKSLALEVAFARYLMIVQHCEFLWSVLVTKNLTCLKHKTRSFLRSVAKG